MNQNACIARPASGFASPTSGLAIQPWLLADTKPFTRESTMVVWRDQKLDSRDQRERERGKTFVVSGVKRLLVLLALSVPLFAQTVKITEKPTGLIYGKLFVPVVATDPVTRLQLVINGVPFAEVQGKVMRAPVHIGYYIRRLRMRAIGYDAQGNVAGEDEMVVHRSEERR